ncbi:hypothetical protein ACH61_00669 [Rathayibacter tanaceti]|uniref:Uncharacterized protein n=1 Tax=Rathayibacter tanaceti TaxID=1671680 RepID=A0A166ID10_9MICO|nr:hypothetical protein ACH61_00669 [Rathayibacter tanaceti]
MIAQCFRTLCLCSILSSTPRDGTSCCRRGERSASGDQPGGECGAEGLLRPAAGVCFCSRGRFFRLAEEWPCIVGRQCVGRLSFGATAAAPAGAGRVAQERSAVVDPVGGGSSGLRRCCRAARARCPAGARGTGARVFDERSRAGRLYCDVVALAWEGCLAVRRGGPLLARRRPIPTSRSSWIARERRARSGSLDACRKSIGSPARAPSRTASKPPRRAGCCGRSGWATTTGRSRRSASRRRGTRSPPATSRSSASRAPRRRACTPEAATRSSSAPSPSLTASRWDTRACTSRSSPARSSPTPSRP